MINKIKETSAKFVLPLMASVAASVIVGCISAGLTMWVMTEKMDTRLELLETKVIGGKLVERTGQIESQIARHEKALDKDFARHEVSMTELSHKTDDQEKRLTRLETLVNETQVLLTEIRADVKILLRGGQQ
ncbi:MAG: hypothetical protein OSJ28_08255 [Desulfovibrio sp.]|jgi:hypothetical protein|nr:hypothetical protein [Desulfovibrio sp.]